MGKSEKVGWVTAVSAIVILMFTVYKCNQNKQEKQGFINMVEAQRDSTRYWTNKAGEEVALRKVIEGQADVVKSFLTKADIAALEARFDVKFKNIRAAITVASKKEGTLDFADGPEIVYKPGDTVYKDCPPCKEVKYMTQKFANPWDTAFVRVGDSAYMKLRSYDTTAILTHRDYDQKFLSRRWYTQVGVSNRNPSVTNTVEGAFVINDSYRDKYFDLSIRGGYRYFRQDASQSAAYAGPELNYYLKRGQFSASYNKLLNNTKWYFVEISGKLVLFRY